MTDSELAILGLLGELGSVSGYGVAAVARARGMERWAGLSATSVYKGLRSLVGQKLVLAKPDSRKSGRGPTGRLFVLAPKGRTRVRQALRNAMEEATEQSVRYRVALAFIELVGRKQAAAQLRSRSEMLASRMREVKSAAKGMQDEASPIGARLVFEYALHGLEAECRVTGVLLALLNDRADGS
jgi:DNA-binding PadR family transcriptional regulator